MPEVRCSQLKAFAERDELGSAKRDESELPVTALTAMMTATKAAFRPANGCS